MTRLRTHTNAGQERHPLPLPAKSTPQSRAAVALRLSRLLRQVTDELDTLPEAERDAVLGRAVEMANVQEDA